MTIVGIDEVGRGCWAGPVVAGAVVLNRPIPGLKDSKKLSKKQRQKLVPEIELNSSYIGLGWVSAKELDEMGLTEAVRLAMNRAIAELQIDYDKIVIDGDYNYMPENPKAEALIKADDTVASVSAASIYAKVARDEFMTKLAQELPNYGFEKHVGYGTAHHLDRLMLHGVTDYHRKSFKPIAALLQ